LFYVVGSTGQLFQVFEPQIAKFEFGAPGGITRRCASPFGSPCGRSPPLRGVVEPELVLCRGFDWAAFSGIRTTDREI
jgi:hypothetical protein